MIGVGVLHGGLASACFRISDSHLFLCLVAGSGLLDAPSALLAHSISGRIAFYGLFTVLSAVSEWLLLVSQSMLFGPGITCTSLT